MRFLVISITAIIISAASAKPQLSFVSGNFDIAGTLGRYQTRPNHGRKSGFTQFRRPDYQRQQTSQTNDQGHWGMCWIPAGSASEMNQRPHQAPNNWVNSGPTYDYGYRPPPPHHHGPPPPPHHRGPPPPPHHHGPPPPPPPYRPHGELESKYERCEVTKKESTSTESVVVVDNSSSAPLLPSSTSSGVENSENEKQVTQIEVNGDNSIKSTTEFDWNNYFVDPVTENVDGVGLIDIRSGGESFPVAN